MLSLWAVQVFAAATLAALVAGFVIGHLLPQPSGRANPSIAARTSSRSAVGAWVGGSLIAAFWSVGVLLAPSYAYDWPPLVEFAGSSVVQVAGFAVAIAGGLLFFAAVRSLGRYMTPEIQLRRDHELVRSGPYRYIRHPAYTGILAGATGSALLYLSLPLAAVTLFLIGMATARARAEERLLGSPEAFGKAYAEYMSKSGRFLPRVSSRK